MEIRETLYVTSREEWRAWLTKHHQSKTEVWLIYYKKYTGQPRISYDHSRVLNSKLKPQESF